jgi:hypothetical protein
MKISIKELNDLAIDERFKFISDNKEDIIKMKKSIIKECDVWELPIIGEKAGNTNQQDLTNKDLNELHVKVVANTANWIDSQNDMLLPDCWKKSITERKELIPHLHDHLRQIDAKVGEVTDIYGEYLTYQDLGIKGIGQTQALIFETDIKKEYNEMVFNQYKTGKIKQHSISLQYLNLIMAINDENQTKEFANWNTYFPLAINQDKAIERGYFFIVKECKIIENSCVLFGANEITPTISVEAIQNQTLPPKQAQIIEPPKKALKAELDYDYLLKKF